jgi:hypothetical protein
MRDSSDRSLWAALIGGICLIIAALIGVSVGNRKADERVQGLQQDVQSRDQSLDSMKSELEKRDAQINALKVSVEEQQRLAAEFKQELAKLESGSTPAQVGTSTDERSGASQPPSEAQVQPIKPAMTRPLVLVREPFRFTLKRCVHVEREQRVRCELVVENISERKEPLLFNPMYYMGGRVSFLATDDGKHYTARIERSAVDNALESTPEYVPGIPTAVSLVFDGISGELGRATLVVEADKGQFGQQYTLPFPPVRVGEESAPNPGP